MPTPLIAIAGLSWPEYADSRLAGLCRSLTQERYGEANSLSGAFFTPFDLARDLGVEVAGRRIVDLCAGVGTLAFACCDEHQQALCVERNARYVKVVAAGCRMPSGSRPMSSTWTRASTVTSIARS